MLSKGLDWASLLSYVLAAGLTILGVLFVLASPYNVVRLPIGLALIVFAVAVAVAIRRRGKRVVQPPTEAKVYAGGRLNVKELKCPKCGGTLQYDQVRKVLICAYCKTVSEVEEEPIW